MLSRIVYATTIVLVITGQAFIPACTGSQVYADQVANELREELKLLESRRADDDELAIVSQMIEAFRNAGISGVRSYEDEAKTAQEIFNQMYAWALKKETSNLQVVFERYVVPLSRIRGAAWLAAVDDALRSSSKRKVQLAQSMIRRSHAFKDRDVFGRADPLLEYIVHSLSIRPESAERVVDAAFDREPISALSQLSRLDGNCGIGTKDLAVLRARWILVEDFLRENPEALTHADLVFERVSELRRESQVIVIRFAQSNCPAAVMFAARMAESTRGYHADEILDALSQNQTNVAKEVLNEMKNGDE